MLISKRQAGQPQGAFKLRSDLGFDSFILPGVGADLVTGAPVVFGGAGTTGNSLSKKSFATVSGSAASIYPVSNSSALLSTTACTVVIAGKSITTGTAGEFGVAANGTGGNVRLGAHIPYTDGTVYFDFGGSTNGATRVQIAGLAFSENDVWVFTVGPRGMEIWQNGTLRASNSATPTRQDDPAGWGFGFNSQAFTPYSGALWFALGYSRKQMPKETCAALSRDLWGTAFVQRRRGLISSLAAAARRRIVLWG